MSKGRPRVELVVGEADRDQLMSMSRSRSLPASLVLRAKIVLGCMQQPNSEVARVRSTHPATVGKWRRRFIEAGLAGLHDEARSGKPRSISDELLAELINKTLQSKPEGGTHWSVRDLAKQTQISKSSVHRLLKLFSLQPHRQETFKLSTDPYFIEKVRDVVGLYLSPPDNAIVLCVDEKSQVQALERTQPLLPMGFGYVEGVTYDYNRHGTTTLFAALNVLDGSVIAQCKPRHRHQEYLAFLRHIERAVPPDLDVHLVCDNYATHKHAKVKAWLAQHPRWHVHYTPTSASWLNQVERFFALITDKAIRRGSFASVRELIEKIELFIAHYNSDSTPFSWTATAESILEKIERLCKRINGTEH